MRVGTNAISIGSNYHLWTRTTGTGPTKLLCLHGGPGGTHEIFENFAAKLAPYHVQVTMYDQLGSYFSESPDWSDPANRTKYLNVAYYVDEVEQVRQALGLEDFYLLGQSWGGLLAMEYALKYGDHLKGLVVSSMIDNTAEYTANLEAIRSQMFSKRALIYMHDVEQRRAYHEPRYQKLLAEFCDHHLHHARAAQPQHLVSVMAPTIYHHFCGDNEFVSGGTLTGWDIRDRLGDITIPTYLMVGEHDTMPLAAIKRMVKTMPQAWYHVTPHAGHGQMLDNPADYFEHLGAFLTR
ncbi:proline iminopeptidase-family hydrolase [Lactiplantibacillus fabifermentans]|uniref:Proline iminopeptidase n=2 Tax=Lactiplantibacillus fabifermentans TaxID=483011 RepID=W6TAT3_9LACO|nr:proline iminopeptidase-family hydrolase [Lactiplantibacillus fabifermentans]ETY75682.1 prolyl aminopeptidase [Lactiplantibacillus fabifermentans T30PCM01]